MDGSAAAVMLTACLAVGGILFRIAIRSDAQARRRYPPGPREPDPLPRDPRVRTAAQLQELFAEPKPRDPGPTTPEDAVPPGYRARH